MSSLVAYLKYLHVFEWCVARYGSKNEHQKDKCLKRYWISCSEHGSHYDRLSIQYNWGPDLVIL